jgi:hypothetical protein
VKQVVLLSMGLWLLGCEDPLKTVELIDEPRVLGARVEVEGDATRAAPAPGERASATLLVAAPELEPALGFALQACPAAPRRGARAACAGPPFARIAENRGDAPLPRLDFEVPAELDPSGRVLLLGVVCPDGAPDADAAACDNGAGIPVQLELELARANDANTNPELHDDSIRFDDAVWPELPLSDGDCGGLGWPEVAPESTHAVEVALDESDRDPLPRESDLDPKRESLQLGHFVSGGDITRAFETVAWDSHDLLRRVDWKAPSEPGLARIWFVLRDFRGGGAFAERAICVKK